MRHTTTSASLPRLLAQSRIFYGWWLAVAGLVVGTLQGLFLGFGFSAFFLPIQQELQASRALLSAAFSLSQLEAGIVGPLNGWLIDRFGARRMMTIGYVIFGLGFMAISQSPSLYWFYAAYVLTALGAGMSGFLPVASTITNWFARRRAIALGVAQSGEGFGGMLVPALVFAIGAYGWRDTAFAIGPIVLLIGLPLAQLFRPRPEEFGLLPDGAEPVTAALAEGGIKRAVVDDDPSLTPRQALLTPAFWYISFAHSLTLFMVSAVNVHQIPALVSAGFSANAAALVLAANTACTVVGRLVFGYLGDRFDRQYALAACFLLQAIAVVALAYASDLALALVFAVLYGFSFGGRGPLLISIRGDFFGRRSFATIMGMSQTVLMLGTIVGPVFAGWVYDVSNSYRIAFLIMAAVNIFAMGVLLAARKPGPVRKAVGV